MCGIAGYLGDGSKELLERATDALKHRGPDNCGYLVRDGVGFGHRRLSIIDTSERGNQPMLLPDKSVAIILNGEVYNYKELRSALEKSGKEFVSESDTEVLLHLYTIYGEDFLKDVRGMFAIALYDFANKKLLLARDRMGEKPLYWTKQGETLWFASELKALFAVGIPKEIDKRSLNQYLQFDYVPTPRTMIEGVYKLEPATILIVSNGEISKKKFWSPPQAELDISEADALEKLDALLADSTDMQLTADVPLGVFLSGGIDSSTVAYYAAKAGKKIDTFSIGFEEKSFDESSFARLAAKHLGTKHHEEVMRSRDALDLVRDIPDVFSEPVADPSVIPTMILSRFARKSVTVALGGDGGDELFAGYPTFQAHGLGALYASLPGGVRKGIERAVEYLPTSHANFSLSYNLKKFVGSGTQDPLHRHLEWLGTFDTAARKRLLGSVEPVFETADTFRREFEGGDMNALLYTYMRTYLMDQVLVKVDRASMHYALETRAPFLDYRVVDFVLALPYAMKYRGTKYLLKQLMKDKLPHEIVFRKKKGFGIPLAEWLTSELRPLSEELLSEESLGKHGLFDPLYVAERKKQHMDKTRDNRKELWNLMVFQMWYQKWMR